MSRHWYITIIFLIPLLTQAREPSGAALLHRAQKALTTIVVHDIFSPPVASRIYLYANTAAYIAASNGGSGFEKYNLRLPQVAPPAMAVHTELATVFAFIKTAQRFVFSEAMLQDSLQQYLLLFKTLPQPTIDASLLYGQTVADSVIAWSEKDGYKETRKLRRFSYSKSDGKWLPTPPGYMAAVEPYWARMRPVALDSAGECKPAPPLSFSADRQSAFYAQALEVYTIGKTLSPEQKAIANFWDCNPFFLNTQGHLAFATKKLSPGGHWISITGIACRKQGADLLASATAYMLVSVALYDGFISCWEEKFRSNLIRPETYINAHMDESWRPLLQTPPFPEYTSGHSVISFAAAVVLTKIFGKAFSFDDDTETGYGLPVRHFETFEEAAQEAAISRFYGGIHYRAAIENGKNQGKKVGAKVLQKSGLLVADKVAAN